MKGSVVSVEITGVNEVSLVVVIEAPEESLRKFQLGEVEVNYVEAKREG